MSRHPCPPRLARAIAAVCIRGDAREVILGDLDQEFSEAAAAGLSPAGARRRYWRQTFASIAAVTRHHKEQRMSNRHPLQSLRGLSLDIRAVTRALRRSPGYAAVAILSLAVGIGANTAIVSVVRQLLLAPLPVERPDELRLVYWEQGSTTPLRISTLNSSGYQTPAGVTLRSNYTYPEFIAMRDGLQGRADITAFNTVRQVTLAIDRQPPASGTGMLVSGGFFSTVRPPMALGRSLGPADDQPGAPVVGVISHALWSRQFGGAVDVIGQTVRVNTTPVEIVGVTGAGYRGLSPGGFSPAPDITISLSQQPLISPEWADPGTSLFAAPNTYWLRVMARIRPGAEADIADALTRSFRAAAAVDSLPAAEAARVTTVLLPGSRGFDSLRTSTVQPLRILSVVVGVVLLLACINVAGLMLARGVSRQKELAVRRALGASRARIMRELLIEGVVLSAAGGVTGVLLAFAAAPVLQTILSSGLGTTEVSLAFDWPLLGITTAIACGAGVLAGLIPAIRFSRNDGAMLKDRTGAAGAPRLLIGRALLAFQIAVSLPLVVGAGLFLRTLHNLTSLDIGFNAEGLVLFAIDPTVNGLAPERASIVFPQLLDRLQQIPGVTSATLIENALLSGWESDSRVTVNGHAATIFLNSVGPNYLDTMGIRLIAGRGIDAGDRADRPRVAVINESAVKEFFPKGSPLGGHIKNGKRELEVVGVMADAKYDGLRNRMPPTMLQSYLQRPVGSMFVMIRAAGPVAPLKPAIERAVADVDPSLPITKFKTQTEQINEGLGRERVFMQLLTTFGGFALLLACVGLHGVTSYSVARRTGEIGIRLALGAQREQVLWMILRQVLVLAGVGLALGAPIAYLLGPAVKSFLFGLDSNDTATLVGSAVVMIVVAAAAGFWPARRAARMEALSALRSE